MARLYWSTCNVGYFPLTVYIILFSVSVNMLRIHSLISPLLV